MVPIAINLPRRPGQRLPPGDPRLHFQATLKQLEAGATVLIRRNIPILAFAADRRGPYIWVPPVAWVHEVFPEAETLEYRVEHGLRTTTWEAMCESVRIVWEEPQWDE